MNIRNKRDWLEQNIDCITILDMYQITVNERYQAQSPFTQHQKTGSLQVEKLRHKAWKCFATNEGGTFVDLYAKIEGLEYVQAVDKLYNFFCLDTGKEVLAVKKQRLGEQNKKSVGAIIDSNKVDYFSLTARNTIWIDPQNLHLAPETAIIKIDEYMQQRKLNRWFEALHHLKNCNCKNVRLGYNQRLDEIILQVNQDLLLLLKSKRKNVRVGARQNNKLWIIKSNEKPNFLIVEGWGDAWAYLDLCLYKKTHIDKIANIIVLNSTTNLDIFIEIAKKTSKDNKYFLCLDNDQTGIEATKKVLKELENAEIWEFWKEQIEKYNCKDFGDWYKTIDTI